MILAGMAIASAMVHGFAIAQQPYPNRPVRLLVGFPPGGTSDILARTIGARLGTALGQPVVIENRPGASGNIAAEQVAKAAPDGYTLIMGTTSLAISQSLYAKLQYDLVRDLAPVTQAANYTNLLVVHPSLPVTSVQELIALARTKPGALHFGSAGNGTPPHMTGAMFNSHANVKIEHIPYKGGAPAITDLIGGQISIMFDNVPPLFPHVKAGKMRPLAVTSLRRIAALPDIPTLDEAGLTGFDSVGWNGVFAPAGTSREIIDRLQSEIAKVLAIPEIREGLIAQGADPVGNSPEAFGAWVKVEVQKWAKVVRDSGARID
ncbi:MAG: Bug family tripartite tricarboxylate transporter substrate binding protein [Burkholderiales bacterium]